MNAKVDGRSARGRPRFGWMDGVERALNDRRMDVREASERARNRNEWRMIVTPYRGNPVVEGGGWAVLLQQCHPNSAGSFVIARRTECTVTPIFFFFFFPLFPLCVFG